VLSIDGPSSLSRISPTLSPRISICAPSSMHGVYYAAVGLINRSGARLRQARPRARVYHRPSIGLLLHRSFGPQRRRLWSKPPASNARRVRCWWSCRCIYSRPVALLPAVIFAIPVHRHPRLQPRRLPRCRSPTSAHGLRQPVGFFLSYIKHHRCTFAGNLHGHFWPAQVSLPTPPTV
jgi:hypothetical protein